jgi:propionyl-CoA carboxylase alpha chain
VIELDGRRHRVDVAVLDRDTVRTAGPTGTVVWRRAARWPDHDADLAGAGPICPLPGTVIAIHVGVGDHVSDGQLLMVVEAMKMEHKITSNGDHVVRALRFAVGDRVDTGDLLVELGEPEGS